MASPWRTHSVRTVYENPWLRLREDEITRPDGRPGRYGVVATQHPTVFVVPVTDVDEVVMIRQHRYPIDRESLEIPAGSCDGEDWEPAARRELLEETGYVADTVEVLGPTYSLNGLADAPGRVLLARGLRPDESSDERHRLEEGISEVRRVPWPELLELIRAGEIHDGESLGALMYAAVALGKIA